MSAYSEARAELDERRKQREAQRRDIQASIGNANRRIGELERTIELVNREAATHAVPAATSDLHAERAACEAAIEDARFQLRQVDSELEHLRVEAAELIEEHRPELVEEAVAASAAEREKILAVCDAIDEWDPAHDSAKAAWDLALSGIKRDEDDPLALQRVGNVVSDATRPWRSALDLISLQTRDQHLGQGRERRWSLPALLRELRDKLSVPDCLPRAYLGGRDRGQGLVGAYEDSAGALPSARVSRENLPGGSRAVAQLAELIATDELGFARLHRVRDLTAEDREQIEIEQALARPGETVISTYSRDWYGDRQRPDGAVELGHAEGDLEPPLEPFIVLLDGPENRRR